MTTRRMSKEPDSPDALLLMQEARAGVPGFFDRACYDFYLRRVFHSLGFFPGCTARLCAAAGTCLVTGN